MAQPARVTTDLDSLLALCRSIASRSPKHLHALLIVVQLVMIGLDPP